MSTENKPSMNRQDHPHGGGQQNNTTPQVEGTGQRVTTNNTQQLNDMMKENEEQKRGKAHVDTHDEDIQREERQP